MREISDHLVAEFGGVPVVAQGENVIKALRPLKNVYCLASFPRGFAFKNQRHETAHDPIQASGECTHTPPAPRSVRPSVGSSRSAAAPLVDIFRSSMWVVEWKRKGEKKRTERRASPLSEKLCVSQQKKDGGVILIFHNSYQKKTPVTVFDTKHYLSI